MQVHLISNTANAAELLLFTKATRLEMSPETLRSVMMMTDEDKAKELLAMARTIRSSWEFVDVVFLVQGVSRSIAQQMTRTRSASYAMQSLRVVDAADLPIVNPFDEPDVGPDGVDGNDWYRDRYRVAAHDAKRVYASLVSGGAAKEDAREILPLGTSTNIVCKYNLRNFVDLVAARSSLRAQGPYREVVVQMKHLVLEAWPWAAPFFEDPNAEAIRMLEGVAREIGITTGTGPGWEIAKAIDLIRKGS